MLNSVVLSIENGMCVIDDKNHMEILSLRNNRRERETEKKNGCHTNGNIDSHFTVKDNEEKVANECIWLVGGQYLR